MSLLSCGWPDVSALVLVLLVATSDFVTSTRLATASHLRVRRALLAVSVVIDIGLLLGWRAVGTLPWLAGMSRGDPMSNAGGAALVVPLGLSFFTLRSLGFVIDVYRGIAAPCSDWFRFAAFLSFFPSFVAGPITRGAPFLQQLQRGLGMSWGPLVEGASIFLQGLAKKMLIADRLATIVDPVFANPSTPLNRLPS